MAISYKISVNEDTLFVETSGIDKNLEEVIEYGTAVMMACVQHKCKFILCDETKLIYKLRPIDTYQLAESLATNAPGVAKAAVVCNPEFIADAKFWETVVVNRGLNVAVFKTIEEARKWLFEKQPQTVENI